MDPSWPVKCRIIREVQAQQRLRKHENGHILDLTHVVSRDRPAGESCKHVVHDAREIFESYPHKLRFRQRSGSDVAQSLIGLAFFNSLFGLAVSGSNLQG